MFRPSATDFCRDGGKVVTGENMTPTVPKIQCCRTPVPCTTCGFCTKCLCQCVMCRGCKRKYLHTQRVLHSCGVCRKCCECRNSPRYTSDAHLHTISIPGNPGGPHILTQLPRTIGIEMEIADWKALPMAGSVTAVPGVTFSIARDWSVKPSEMEMVLAPLRGDAVVRGMLELSRTLQRNGCLVNDTCAMHVHVGGRDLSYFDLRRLLTVYETIEPELYEKFLLPHRRELPSIHYCQMMTQAHVVEGCERCVRYDRQYPGQRRIPEALETTLSRMWLGRTTEDLKVCLLRMLYDIENPINFPTTVATRKGGHYEFCRYFGLNLHSWMHRHTVEWRQKEATTDPWEMVFWPLWCGWMVHSATRMTDADARRPWTMRSVTERWMPRYFTEWLGRHGV